MQVDFYQLAGEPPVAAAVQLAGKVLASGERLLLVADAPMLAPMREALWAADGFLANDVAGGPHDTRQPILLSDQVIAANGARFLLLADGQWRDPGTGFDRVMLLFGDATLAGARDAWRGLGAGATRNYWKRVNGRWAKGP